MPCQSITFFFNFHLLLVASGHLNAGSAVGPYETFYGLLGYISITHWGTYNRFQGFHDLYVYISRFVAH